MPLAAVGSAMCATCTRPRTAQSRLLHIILLSLLVLAAPTCFARPSTHLSTQSATVGCQLAVNWTLPVTSLTVQPGTQLDRPLLLLSPNCELVTIANSCNDPAAPCWDIAIGIDLRLGLLTFNLTLPSSPTPNATRGAHNQSGDLYTDPVLSSDKQLVYWSRLVSNTSSSIFPSSPSFSSSSSSSFSSSSSSSSSPCAEVVAFTHGPAPAGGQLQWRSEMCGINVTSSSTVQLLVFSELYCEGADDVLLQQQLGEAPTLRWRSLRGSTGEVLHTEQAAFPQAQGSWVSSRKQDNSGVFSVSTAVADAPSWACSLSSDGRWQVVRNYTRSDSGEYGGFADNGAVILQRMLDYPYDVTRLRGVELLTGRVLWTKSVDSTILHNTWMPAPYASSVTAFQDGSDDKPELAVLQSHAGNNQQPPSLVAVNGFIDQRTGESYTTDVLPPYEAAPLSVARVVNWWLDAHTVASWVEWRWFVYTWPDMRILAYGDADLRVEYGDGASEMDRLARSLPRIVGFDSSVPAVMTVYSLVDRVVGRTFSGSNYTGLPNPYRSSCSSSSSSSSAGSQLASSLTSAPDADASSSGASANSSSSEGWAVWIGAVVLLGVLLSVALGYAYIRRRRAAMASAEQPLLA